MLEAIRVNRACAFCEKREWRVEYLIEGPSAYICYECVLTSAGVLEQRRSATPAGESTGRVLQASSHSERRYAY